jgi:hypothetical protein
LMILFGFGSLIVYFLLSNLFLFVSLLFLSFSISQLLISKQLQLSHTTPYTCFPFLPSSLSSLPHPTSIILNFQSLYPPTSGKPPDHPPRNQNFAPIQPHWGDRLGLQLFLSWFVAELLTLLL